MADSPDLQRLLQDKHEALHAYRDAVDDEIRATAWIAVDEASKALDAALVDKETARSDNERMAAVEARDAAAKMVGSVEKPPQPAGLPVEDIRAFAKGEKGNFQFMMEPPAQRQIYGTDMTTVDTTGYLKYTIPQSWVERIIMFQIAQSGVLQAGPTILETATGQQINVPTLTTDMSSVAGAEGAAATVTNPVIGTAALNQYRVDGFVALSNELLRDSGVNLDQVLGDLAGRTLAAKMAPYFANIATGTGASLVPAAVGIGTTLGVTAVSQTTPTFDEVKTLFYTLLPQYRTTASFVGNTTLTRSVALAKDDTGNYLWQPSNIADQPDRIFGRPWYEDSYMAASTTGLIPLYCGDFGAGYWVRRIGGMEVGFSADFSYTSFETTMRFACWFDAVTVDTLAIKHLILA